MSSFQKWLFRWCVRSALSAMPYTVEMYRIIREEHGDRYYEDNVFTARGYQQEAFDHAWTLRPWEGT